MISWSGKCQETVKVKNGVAQALFQRWGTLRFFCPVYSHYLVYSLLSTLIHAHIIHQHLRRQLGFFDIAAPFADLRRYF